MSEQILANLRGLENLTDDTDTVTVWPRSGLHDKLHKSPLLLTVYGKVLRSVEHKSRIYSTLAVVDTQCN